ncbi:OmpA family protein [Pseudomonas nitroreducens]|uniref:OmpA family protein n=1 Tax=Pseudomonas nitroreducens TaxID=46680 RepID=UPI0002EA4975|nr:OmpA family protein [Pseudomonas nitroreducens]
MSVIEEKLRLGGDPQGSEPSAALGRELAKLSHPARPDMDWARVERLCLAQFREHGMELQAVAAFVLARAQLRGPAGLDDGLELLERLLQRDWERLWPPAYSVRLEILGWLLAELRPWLRGLQFSAEDLPELLRLDDQLKRLEQLLGRHEAEPLPPLPALRGQLLGLLRRLAPDAATAEAVVAPRAAADEVTTAVAPNPVAVSPTRRRTPRKPRSEAPAVVVLNLDSAQPSVEPPPARKRRPFWTWLLLLGALVALTGLFIGVHSHWQGVKGLGDPSQLAASSPMAGPSSEERVRSAAVAPIRLDGQLLFAPGKAELKPDSTKVLVNSLINIKAQPGWLIVITGHSDSTGDPQRNLELSRNRAAAVRDWMQRMGDIPDDCFVVRGAGASEPVAAEDSEEGRNANRRVEITLTPEGGACEKR